MKILELFSGTECLSDAFRARGHKCYTVDWDEKFPSTLHIDIMQLTAEKILTDFGRPDVIWAGCDCTTFSVAAIGFHRRKNPATGSLEPKTEKAAFADRVNKHTLDIIRQLRPHFFFIENPMGGLRKMDYMQGLPRHLITYCQYGFPYRKATDIWTNHPRTEFRPPCKNGDPCHEAAPRGTKQGLQGIQGKADRSKYPPNSASTSWIYANATSTWSRCPSRGTSTADRRDSWICSARPTEGERNLMICNGFGETLSDGRTLQKSQKSAYQKFVVGASRKSAIPGTQAKILIHKYIYEVKIRPIWQPFLSRFQPF